MQFSDTSTKSGIVQEIDDICQSDSNSYPIESKTRRVNSALDRFFTLAFKADGRWAFDDVNQTDEPIDAQDLKANQQVYSFDDFAYEMINVLRVEMLDPNSKGVQLTRLDREIIPGALTEYKNVAGTPNEYDLLGKSIYLYPKPNYNMTDGLKFYFNRNKSAFVYTDTTKEPGIPSIFHTYICRLAALPYLIEFQKPQKNDIATLVAQDEAKIEEYFTRREKGVRQVFTPKPFKFR